MLCSKHNGTDLEPRRMPRLRNAVRLQRDKVADELRSIILQHGQETTNQRGLYEYSVTYTPAHKPQLFAYM